MSRVPGLPPWGWANRASDTGSFSGVKRARASVPPLPLRIPGSGCHHCSMVASVTRGTSWSAAVATREWAGRAAPHGGRPRACGAQSDWRPGWADPPPPSARPPCSYLDPAAQTGWDVAAMTDAVGEYSGSCGGCHERPRPCLHALPALAAHAAPEARGQDAPSRRGPSSGRLRRVPSPACTGRCPGCGRASGWRTPPRASCRALLRGQVQPHGPDRRVRRHPGPQGRLLRRRCQRRRHDHRRLPLQLSRQLL